jgi:hypothetical protein
MVKAFIKSHYTICTAAHDRFIRVAIAMRA